MNATLNVMADKGFIDFTVADVAVRAGVHETTIYRRWGTRENLISDALLLNSQRVIPIPDTGSVRSDLYELLCAIAEYLDTPLGRAVTQAFALSGDEARWGRLRSDFWTGRLELARAVIDRAVQRGEVPANTNPRLILETLISPLQFRVLVTRESFDRNFCKELTDLVLDGIVSPSHTAKE